MHSIPILAAFFGGLAVAKASTGADSCTTTVTTVANPAPYAITSGLNSASTLMISAAPNNSEAASTVDSLVSGAAASSLPVSFGSDFTNPASGSA
ncbi:MAG: hypothetical protein LQ348_007670, partial [Seirophora lacunosa]